MKRKPSLFTIRKKKKERHPQLIVGANKTKFKSMSITHSKKNGYHGNLKLKMNPNNNDPTPSYLKKRIIEDFKFYYSKAFKNYHLTMKILKISLSFWNQKRSSAMLWGH